jgi:hypothetical protein
MRQDDCHIYIYSRLQASIRCFASFKLMKQWVFRHSARKVPLKPSTKALSAGLTGLEKSILLRSDRPTRRGMTGELAAVVAEHHLRNTAFELELIRVRTTSSPFKLWPTSITTHSRG